MKSVRVFLAVILGLLLCSPVFSDEKFEEALKKAEAGDAKSQLIVGACYSLGVGVLKDRAKAAKWYLKAAEQGDEGAQYELARMYEKGNVVPKDKAKAAKWYLKAAEQGNAFAQLNLGVSYVNGSGVQKDKAKAYMFFNLAAAKGDETGKNYAERLKRGMTKRQLAEGQKLTRKWLARKAKENGE